MATIRDWSNFIAGRVAIVTGGGGGVGRAICIQLARAGAEVWVNDLYGDRAEKVVREIEEEGSAAHPVVADVTYREAVAGMVRDTGPVDILVNNAGTSFARSIDDLTDEEWYGQFELHVMASMRLMRAFAPGMAERGWGRIVNVTSSAGKRPSLTNAAYSVTKAAQSSLSRVFADTYGARGVLVNAVAPGPVSSSLWMDEGGLADQTATARGLSREESVKVQAE